MEESENSATDLVFVYGTLKRGFYNWERYLRPELGAEFIATAETVEKYPLVIEGTYGIPFLINQEGIGHNIQGEIFAVTRPCLQSLDLLEGYPQWYDRHLIPLKCSDGRLRYASVYTRNLDESPMDWEKMTFYALYSLEQHDQFYVAGLAKRA
ncbi:Troponin C-akin-1 protein, putative [Perkinsus marinus ATCC 50983]|uniref:Gamma-glutamylcyclotransferase family protein n=1 Tax=Perkinsus marinus (strain ATCC 50983 / TXsc) TaxID=423536 RepID=C5LQ75_PERM5|nr:Troponin C-akin-1 protein, putative [Perkinsus marinus ATCC 50983]EER01119.1 Troponin C-akin-1 protein, putative [Perkinsus marinus ATCC 50983]|eukprot:XP_002768401.1 Troponin C-akin-1 protein, putative [Perkinsus marinus ATCC 50983]